MVMEVVQEDMGDGNMQCTNHPYKNSTPGGICAFCLQEKLGKLVSSSFPIAILPASSSSSSPSFRSDYGTSSVQVHSINASSSTINNTNDRQYSGRSRIPFLFQRKKKKKKDVIMAASDQTSVVFKRSKSTTTPRRSVRFLEADYAGDYSSQKRGFWSYLYHPKHSSIRKTRDICHTSSSATSTALGSFSQQRPRDKKKHEFEVVEENEGPDKASVDRKVSRSRSVGCGSRSFSGDIFERISTGFGDCTLRRVESQREGKSKVNTMHHGGGQDYISKERVKCGGIFSGFMIASSSSSSSSSSYWVSSSTEDNVSGKAGTVPVPASAREGHLVHGRIKSWGWAFASPIRAFSKSSSGKREGSNKNATPNLAAIPSLLAVRA